MRSRIVDTSPLRSSLTQIGPPMQISGTPTRQPFHGSGMTQKPGMQKPGRLKQTLTFRVSKTMSTFFTSTVLSLFSWTEPPLRWSLTA